MKKPFGKKLYITVTDKCVVGAIGPEQAAVVPGKENRSEHTMSGR